VIEQKDLVREHLLTPEERQEFEKQGFLTIRNALSSSQLERFLEIHERIYREEKSAGRLAPAGGVSNRSDAMHSFAFILRDPAYLELLDLPTTLPKVWGILGWNIYMYHCHIDQHPPLPGPLPPVWGWHQDGGRQNLEIETEPTRPRLSVKLAYWLSDVSQPGRGNFMVVPGSHVRNRIPRPEHPELGFENPPGAIQVTANPGDAVLFDRRLWHSRSDNLSDITRKAFFTGYTYRWIRTRDDYPIDWESEPFRSLSPVRKQLLGWGKDAMSFWALGTDTFPLREWLKERGLVDLNQSNLR
jgi:ectoine hydroxylase